MSHPLPYDVNCSILFTELPLRQQLTDLKAAGYDGWVGLEQKPSGASADSFSWIQS